MLSIVYWILYIFNFACKITTNFWNVQILVHFFANLFKNLSRGGAAGCGGCGGLFYIYTYTRVYMF